MKTDFLSSEHNPLNYPHPQPVMPAKTLLQGKQYTPAANTDIRKLFEKVKRQRVVDAIPDPFGDRA